MSMLVPSVFGRNLFDDFFDGPLSGGSTAGLMRTDVRESEDGYKLVIDLPGVKKEDVKAELKDGCLTVRATTGYENDEKDDAGRYIRRERFAGSFQRSFYVGEDVKREDIKAGFADGVLTLDIPKKPALPKVEESHTIEIG